MTIGSNSAETDDDFLFDCFVRSSPVERCMDVHSPGMIVAGRTGAGKTAILRYIEREVEHSIEIDPSEMSMSYVSNSDALNFLQAIGADLDLLFHVLWKHVICIEFIRLRWSVNNEDKSKKIFSRIFESVFTDARKQKAVQYLRQWEGKFWITMDQNIKEITEKVERNLKAELGGEIQKFVARGQYEKQISTEKKSELVKRSKKVINEDQLRELNGVVEILAEQAQTDKMSRFYILIDKLDDRWVDVSIQFRLIRALIESLKSFRKITNLKILVALRSDILERVAQEPAHVTFQKEKFEDYFINLKWNKHELKELVNRRVEHLFKRQYTDGKISFEDVFPNKVGKDEAFDYLIDRTLLRPRDIIAFVNQCLAVAEGHYHVTANMIHKAEAEYSRGRREAMESEWRSAFPSLKALLNFLDAKRKASLSFEELCIKEKLDELVCSILSENQIDYDPIYQSARAVLAGKEPTEFMKDVVAILYRVGAIGIKLHSSERFLWSHVDMALIATAKIENQAHIRIHPILHGSFRLHAGKVTPEREGPSVRQL